MRILKYCLAIAFVLAGYSADYDTFGESDYNKLVVYGEACRLGDSKLVAEKIEFRQTPYDVVTRR